MGTGPTKACAVARTDSTDLKTLLATLVSVVYRRVLSQLTSLLSWDAGAPNPSTCRMVLTFMKSVNGSLRVKMTLLVISTGLEEGTATRGACPCWSAVFLRAVLRYEISECDWSSDVCSSD